LHGARQNLPAYGVQAGAERAGAGIWPTYRRWTNCQTVENLPKVWGLSLGTLRKACRAGMAGLHTLARPTFGRTGKNRRED